ncbi:hypothetical protein BC739_001059 [Kutzneria viridogrisea]|uniref:Uncharacterized protein n=1 Tax=Kutzneria viridogrisea TaxID=47990 RepID=A0ABR6BAI9_9PSEU|nr:hypothetical protein [Kutzneria viridogrisea]
MESGLARVSSAEVRICPLSASNTPRNANDPFALGLTYNSRRGCSGSRGSRPSGSRRAASSRPSGSMPWYPTTPPPSPRFPRPPPATHRAAREPAYGSSRTAPAPPQPQQPYPTRRARHAHWLPDGRSPTTDADSPAWTNTSATPATLDQPPPPPLAASAHTPADTRLRPASARPPAPHHSTATRYRGNFS